MKSALSGWAALVGAGLALIGEAAGQDEMREAARLSRLLPYQGDYNALPADERDQFRIGYFVRANGDFPVESLRLAIVGADGMSDLEITESHRLIPPAADIVEADPMVWTNSPPGAMALNMTFEAALPAAESYAVESLETAMDQANRASRRAAGMAALFAPRIDTAVFWFDEGPVEGWAERADGERLPLEISGEPWRFRANRSDMRDVVRIHFDAEPVRIVLDAD